MKALRYIGYFFYEMYRFWKRVILFYTRDIPASGKKQWENRK